MFVCVWFREEMEFGYDVIDINYKDGGVVGERFIF